MRWTHIVASLVLLFALPSSAGAYTVKRTTEGAMLHWRTPSVRLAIHASTSARFGEQEARSALTQAIAAWSEARLGPSVVLTEDTDAPPGFEHGRAVNGVYSVSPWPYERKLLAVTVSSYDTRTGELLDADILLNGDERLVVGAAEEHYDLTSILTHELGHVLGLGEAEDEPASTMYPRIGKAELRARTPSADDFLGIATIYGRPAARYASMGPLRFRGFGATAAFFAGFLVLLVGLRRSTGETSSALVRWARASDLRLIVRWSPRPKWDDERMHS